MTREERQAWLSHPCTQELVSNITIEREGIKEFWSNGVYPAGNEEREALGSTKALQIALDFIEEVGGKDGETDTDSSSRA